MCNQPGIKKGFGPGNSNLSTGIRGSKGIIKGTKGFPSQPFPKELGNPNWNGKPPKLGRKWLIKVEPWEEVPIPRIMKKLGIRIIRV